MKGITGLLAATVLAVAPSPALAQSSTCQAYNPQLCGVAGEQSTESSEVVSQPQAGSTLPFTGVDVALLAGGGLLLLAAGTYVRRYASTAPAKQPPAQSD